MSANSKKKQVCISGNADGANSSSSETILQRPNSDTGSGHKQKIKKTKLQILKYEKAKLQNNLACAEEAILEDSARKASPNYTPYENRWRLARAAFDTVSKLQQIKGEIVTTKKENREKNERKLTTKLRKRFVNVEKQHNRLIRMTQKLERMKISEEKLRAEITRELEEGVRDPTLLTDAEQSPLRLPRINSDSASANWKKLSKSLPEGNVDDEDGSKDSSELACSMRKSMADRLAHKYDMTRELRNSIHEHMITRSYRVSYFDIIPPYKHKVPKPQKSKKGFNRLVLENKMEAMDSSKMQSKKAQKS